MPRLTINDREIEVPAGETIIRAAERLGIRIPYFCYHPDLSIAGNCRMCMVHVEKAPKLMISCQTPVADGMVVQTETAEVREARRSVLEFLLRNHPIDCPVCDQSGECYLQDHYMAHGLYTSRVPLEEKLHKDKVVDLGPIVLDQERCVYCSRCIRFCDEVSRTHDLGFFHRADHVVIDTYDRRPVTPGYAGNLADVCPVGALTSREFRFKQRVWFLTSTPSVCGGCSTGCNLKVEHRAGVIYRILPRRNPEVNRSWICDIGRGLYAWNGAPHRAREPLVKRDGLLRPAAWGEALDAVVAGLRRALDAGGSAAVAGIASSDATNEELYLFRLLLRDVLKTPHVDVRVDGAWRRVAEREDAVLRRCDHHPNTRGALDLGLVPGEGGLDVDGILAAARRGEIRVLFIERPEWILERPDKADVAAALRAADHVIMFATHTGDATLWADVLLPVTTWAETEGTFTNYARRVQVLRAGLTPPGEARPAWRVLRDLLERLGCAVDAETPAQIVTLLGEAAPDYAGLTFGALGPHGRALPTEAPGEPALAPHEVDRTP